MRSGVIFAVVLAALVACGAAAQRWGILRGAKPIVASAKAPRGSEWYVSYNRGGIDLHLLSQDLHGSMQAAKDADVLFVGNSRVMFAFRQPALKPFFARLGLRYYVLAFPYAERNLFAEALIQRHDLRPRWMIVNSDPFFVDRVSGVAEDALRSNPFSAWKLQLETATAFSVQHRLHALVPHWAPTGHERDWVLFRSYGDGTTHVGAVKGTPRPAKLQLKGRFAHVTAEQLEAARRFKLDANRRGCRLVFTSIPPRSPDLARELGGALRVPVVLPEVPKLMTCDGSHLDDASARRYAEAFLSELEPILAGRANPIPLPATLPFRLGPRGTAEADDDD